MSSFWGTFIPDTSVYNVGIIFDIQTKFTIEGIEDGWGLNSKLRYINLKGWSRAVPQPEGPPVYQALHSVKVFCKGLLSEFKSIFTLWRRVQLFIPPVTRCYSREGFGHGASTR